MTGSTTRGDDLKINSAEARLAPEGTDLPSPRTIHTAKKQKMKEDGHHQVGEAIGNDVQMNEGGDEDLAIQVSTAPNGSDTVIEVEATVPAPNGAEHGSEFISRPSLVEALPDVQAHQAKHPSHTIHPDSPIDQLAQSRPPLPSTDSAPPTPPTPGTPSNDHELLPLPEPDMILEEKDKAPEKVWDLRMSWGGKVFDFQMSGEDRVFDLKGLIYSLTSVPPERQKIVGLGKGKLAGDEELFQSLKLPLKHKFTCIGTSEQDTFKDPTSTTFKDLPELMDNFDVTYSSQASTSSSGSASASASTATVARLADDPRCKRLLKQKIEQCNIDVMSEPRPGKRLLVLDLDYTILDTEPLLAGSLPASECCRPGLHEFLELVYPHYDIAIWSQTHWRWLESKLLEMGMIGDPARAYRISFVADRTSMFPVFGTRQGQPYKHEVKPLAFLWAKFPQYSSRNTIHIDDSRNFALNPGEGLKIRAFKGAGTAAGIADHQLKKLGKYLIGLTQVEDFGAVDHNNWKKPALPPPPR